MDRRAYFRAYKKRQEYRDWENDYRSQLRARGLCIQCMEISVKYVRCNRCRAKSQANRQRRAGTSKNGATLAA